MNEHPAAGRCAYCDLPLGTRLVGDREAERGDLPRYCCYGCQFAAAVTGAEGDAAAARWMLTRLGFAVFFTMNVMVFMMAVWSYDVYSVASEDAFARTLVGLMQSLCLVFALPVLLLLGVPIAHAAIGQMSAGLWSTDLLVVVGVAAAYVYSAVSVLRGEGATYFEVGCMVLVMVTLGRWLEASGKLRASQALDHLGKLLPARVRVCRAGRTEQVETSAVQRGDVVLVCAGERFPADGTLLQRSATVDEQLISGEAWPVVKRPGDPIIGGTLNLDGDAAVEVTATTAAGTLTRLVEAVRQARAARGRHQQLADAIVARFFPVVAVLAVVTLIGHGLTSGCGNGLMAALAVVLVACPCALGLATPLALWAGLAHAAERGIVFRSGQALERLAEVRGVRFDKTGTLTTGTPSIARVIALPGLSEREVLARSARLASHSSHVFAQAIRRVAGGHAESLLPSEHTWTIPGLGIWGYLRGEASPTVLGSEPLMTQHQLVIPPFVRSALDQVQTDGLPTALVGWDGTVRGVIAFREQLRSDAIAAVDSCSRMGLDVAVLTGDHLSRGRQLALTLGVPVLAELRPDDKARLVRQAEDVVGPLAMVGDGVNDALAVAAAQVGMVMGHGPDLTRDAGDVCLLSNELMRVPAAIELARRTVRTIRWNLAWAFGYNSLGLAAAAWGYLHPALAAVLMLVSSVLVIANSLRLLRTSGAGPNEARHAVAALVHGQEDHSQDGVRMRPAAAPPRGDDPT